MIKAFIDLIEREKRPGMLIAEVGVHVGATTAGYLPIVSAMGGHVYAIDTFNGSPDGGGVPGHHGGPQDQFYRRFLAAIEPWKECVTILRGVSWEMAREIPRGSLDIGFIDADHRYKSAKADIRAYWPTVKDGGLLCGHDCDFFDYVGTYTPEELDMDCTPAKGHAGVIQAVFEFFGREVEILPDPVTPPVWVKRL
jgi:Methyltransferase domain